MAGQPPARTATLTYDQHDTATRIILPNQTLWSTVPKGSILHIDELALYHLTDNEYQAEIEISPFFKQHSFVLDPELEERITEEGTQLIDLTPVDTALEAIARLLPAGAPIIRSWSAADTALSISTIVGYVVTLTLAFLLHKRVNAVQESFNKCTSGVPRIFRRLISELAQNSIDNTLKSLEMRCKTLGEGKTHTPFLSHSKLKHPSISLLEQRTSKLS